MNFIFASLKNSKKMNFIFASKICLTLLFASVKKIVIVRHTNQIIWEKIVAGEEIMPLIPSIFKKDQNLHDLIIYQEFGVGACGKF